jgi:uncharacterized membrane protein YfcA
MAVEGLTLQSVSILFVATLVRSIFGFGEALIAVPLLALLMPVKQAAPLAVLVSITIALIILLQDWRKVHFRSAVWLILATIPGIPAGLWLLRTLPEAVVKALLGILIAAFAAHALFGRNSRVLHDDRLAWLFGFQAGVLGGAYGMNGPPLAIYGSLRRWQPEHFRATLQAYFFPASVLGMAGYWLAGLWTPAVNHYYIASLPGVLLAVLAGRVINRRLHPLRFTSFVYVGLALIGAVLLLQSMTR